MGDPDRDARLRAAAAHTGGREASLLVYDARVVGALETVQARYIAASRVLDPAAWAERPLGQQVVQNSARLADSLL